MANINIDLPDNLYAFDEEARIGLALSAYWKSQAHTDIPSKNKLSLRATAKLFDIPHSTLMTGLMESRHAGRPTNINRISPLHKRIFLPTGQSLWC